MTDMKQVAALFVRKDSIYKSFAGVDAWDRERDARGWPGGCPAVAHPPCAQWGTLSHMARVNPAEKYLAILAVQQIRANGGVLEHPKRSKLWVTCELPAPGGGRVDGYGGWTLPVSQKWWDHPAEKPTLLYIGRAALHALRGGDAAGGARHPSHRVISFQDDALEVGRGS